MRGIYTPVTDIRRKVFTEVARMSYESNEMADYAKEIRDLPFKIMPGEDSSLRSSIFLERAIVSERIRLAMGLSLRPVTESVSATEDLEHSVIADKYYEPPLINVIKFACNKCPEKIIKVTSMCQGCLAHPCQEVCPWNRFARPTQIEAFRPKPTLLSLRKEDLKVFSREDYNRIFAKSAVKRAKYEGLIRNIHNLKD